MHTLIFLTLLGMIAVLVIFFASVGLGVALVMGGAFTVVMLGAYFLDGLSKGWRTICKILRN
jgi:hypothetical protein